MAEEVIIFLAAFVTVLFLFSLVSMAATKGANAGRMGTCAVTSSGNLPFPWYCGEL
jgi:hypothetical protein